MYLIFIITNTMILYLIMILVSFNPADPSWMQSEWKGSIYNSGGIIGARISDFLFFCFGYSSYLIPIFVLIYIWKFFLEKKLNIADLLLKLLIFLFTSCVLSNVILSDVFYFSPGGIVGNILFDFFCFNFWYILYFFILIMIFSLKYKNFLLNKIFLFLKIIVKRKIKLFLYFFIPNFFKNQKKQCIFLNKKRNFHIRFFSIFFCTKQHFSLNTKNIKTSIFSNKSNVYKDKDFVIETGNLLNFNKKNNSNKIKIAPVISIMLSRNYNIDEFYKRSHTNYYYPSHQHMSQHFYNTVTQDNQTKNITNQFSIQIEKNFELVKDFGKKFSNNKNLDKNFSKIKNSKNQKNLILFKNNEKKMKLKSAKDNSDTIIKFNNKFNNKNNDYKEFKLPNTNLLTDNSEKNIINYSNFHKISRLIEEKLLEYRILANVAKITPGPVVTCFELDLSAGIKSAKISGLSKDLARSLSVPSIRVIEIIPGTTHVGIEIPNKKRYVVYFRNIICSDEFQNFNSPLILVLGLSISGKPVIKDLKYMPHLLVAGTTGSGKSVGINSMIISILYNATPEEVRFIMIDPKILELSIYSGIPHLLKQVITDMQDVESILQWCVTEMENRYKLMSIINVRNLESYNCYIKDLFSKNNESHSSIKLLIEKNFEKFTYCKFQISKKLPYIVIVIDEFSDLMISTDKKIETLIVKLTQKARAAGIHIILATQRPSVNVITGVIKANIPARISFTVSSKIDSRTILDQSGAETLLGMGDMLYLPPDSSSVIRVHGAYITDQEICKVVKFWKNQMTNAESLYRI